MERGEELATQACRKAGGAGTQREEAGKEIARPGVTGREAELKENKNSSEGFEALPLREKLHR